MLSSARVAATDNALDAETLCTIVRMHDAFASITFGEAAMIGDVIFVREKHLAHALHRINFFHELGRKTWRVDQNISTCGFGPND